MRDVCEVCNQTAAKYKCPKCFRKTCSLSCSKEHKAMDKCDGKCHDPTAYIPNDLIKNADDAKHESNILVQRDYNFLTNIKRVVELKRRDGKAKNKRTLQDSTQGAMAGKKPRLAGPDCSRIIRRGVNCLVVPRGMQRSLANKSKWDKSMDLFVWTIEWIVFPPNSKTQDKFCHISHRIRETDTLIESMGKIVYDKCCDFYDLANGDDANAETKMERTKRLLDSGLNFFTKWFPYNTTQALDSKKLVPLDSSRSIAELFRNKTVIEFPTIFVALADSDLPREYSTVDEHELEVGKQINSTTASVDEEDASETDDAPTEESSKRASTIFRPMSASQGIELSEGSKVSQNANTTKTVVSLPTNSNDVIDDCSDSDGYDPGITMDFLGD